MKTGIWMVCMFLLATALAVGCGQSTTTKTTTTTPQTDTATAIDQHHAEHTAASNDGGRGNAHSGWWCDEHGVPEEVCALCNSKVAAEFQKKGDWCREHDRPDSQCFLCHPELEAKFAAQYEARYGKKPPRPEG